MKRALIISLILLFVLTAFAGAEDKTVQFKYKYNPGDIDKYRMLMDMDLNIPNLPTIQGMTMPMKIKLGVTIRQKVLGILPDGSARVHITYNDFKFDMPDLPQEVANKVKREKLPDMAIVVRVAPDGKLLETSVINSKGKGQEIPIDQFTSVMGKVGQFGVFPDWPVKVGDGWKQTIPFPFGGGDMKIISMVEAAALPMGNHTVSKVKQTYESHLDFKNLMQAVASAIGSSGQMPKEASDMFSQFSGGMDLNGWGVFYFSPSRGKLIKANASMKADIAIGMPAASVQQGAPSNIMMTLDLNMSVAKI